MNNLKTSNKVLRIITISLQIAAMLAFYVPSIISPGNVAFFWLLLGVAQTILFIAIFFRDSRTRTAISIVLMVTGTFVNLALLMFIGVFALVGTSLGLYFHTAFIYIACSLLAVIFALCFPRKYKPQINN
ncbi:MAG: hypothetical protein LBD23_04805 [Oscillospiraceae bacterium]|jgi:hypothetical protein|nr:hypothetical protein [Oscillospiraceae bacterium]